jgi:SAM-dependent methyltransferase
MEVFFELPGVPVNSCLLVDSRDAALTFPRGDIALGFCGRCGFISNVAFRGELTEYSGRYEETQGYSETFNAFHRALASELVDRLGLRNKRILEIGCGKGEFLSLICRLGANQGIGFDPSYDDSRDIVGTDIDVRVRKEFFDASSGREDADVVCCKMTLEHIADTAQFVRAARRALRPATASLAFFQVPESGRILRECALEDIYYEHCSYFTPGSLARLFRREGFDVQRMDIAYAGQYLTLEATLAGSTLTSQPLPLEEAVAQTASEVHTFAARYRAQARQWSEFVEQRASEGPVLLWGSGSKAVAFLRAVECAGAIGSVVDINPYRRGHYMPGTGQAIVGPQDVAALAPRAVIAMNPIYREEIAAELQHRGVQVELVTL